MFRFSATKKQAEPKTALTIDCPSFDSVVDSVISFTEPVNPRLDLDLEKGAGPKKNRQGLQITSPTKAKATPPPRSPSFLFSPTRLLSRLQPKKAKSRDTMPNYPTATSCSFPFESSRLSLPPQPARLGRASSEGRPTLGKPRSSDEETEKHLCGFYVRKSTVALSADDFDSMLFHEEAPTLKLTLTPKWLHSGL